MRSSNCFSLAFCITALFCMAAASAVADELPQAEESAKEERDTATAVNKLDIDAQLFTRGEIRVGGLPENSEKVKEDLAAFLMERTRLVVGYERPYFDAKISVQHAGVWGQAGKGTINLYETWARFKLPIGLFAKIGRQELTYDNERIIGSDDWAMAAASHDVGKFGYEGHGHKAHLILGFNQNAENINGGTYYEDGAQPYKSMQTLWYHYDFERAKLGTSVLFMNLGVQDVHYRLTRFQHLAGVYMLWEPKSWQFEGSYYRQFGRSEINLPIKAWMASAMVKYQLNPQLNFTAGYDYLSGDEFYYVRGQGKAGLVRHKDMRGFSTLYGSHHQFYGAMDFFYLSAYADGFSPGLQNLYTDIEYKPVKPLAIKASYHYLATSVTLKNLNRSLGHEIELSADYRFIPFAKLSAGYSFMVGTDTMKALKRTSDSGRLHWAWLSLNITPRIFSTKW